MEEESEEFLEWARAKASPLSAELTAAICDQRFNLQLRERAGPPKKMVTYSHKPPPPSKPVPHVRCGDDIVELVSGPQYDRTCTVVQQGTAWLGGKATFVEAAPDGEPVRVSAVTS